MLFAASVIALGSLTSAAAAAAAAAPGFQFPDAVPLDRRQTDDPSYECHANCGYAIKNSAKDGYCKDDAWKKLLDGCLDCALEQNIWQYYGDKVGAAAKKCGLDATPKAASGGQSSAAPTTAAAISTAAAPSTAVAHPSTVLGQSSQQSPAASAAPTPTVPGTTVASAAGSIIATASAPVSSGAKSNTTASAAPTSVTVSQASHMFGPSMLVAGAAVLFAATWF